MTRRNDRDLPGYGDCSPPDEPVTREGTEDEVLAMCDADALATVDLLAEVDGDMYGDLSDGWTDTNVINALRDYHTVGLGRHTRAPLVVRRSIPVAVVGMAEGWESPVVVRLPDPVVEERDQLQATVEAIKALLDARDVPTEQVIDHETDEGTMCEAVELDTSGRVMLVLGALAVATRTLDAACEALDGGSVGPDGLAAAIRDVMRVAVARHEQEQALREERDRLRARLRATCQTAVEAIGAPGPMNAEEAVAALAADWDRLRAAIAAIARAVASDGTEDLASMATPDEIVAHVADLRASAEAAEVLRAEVARLRSGIRAIVDGEGERHPVSVALLALVGVSDE